MQTAWSKEIWYQTYLASSEVELLKERKDYCKDARIQMNSSKAMLRAAEEHNAVQAYLSNSSQASYLILAVIVEMYINWKKWDHKKKRQINMSNFVFDLSPAVALHKETVSFPTNFLSYTRHGCCCHALPTSI